jgi:hypothetical protein
MEMMGSIMNKQRIKELALANGFKLKEQHDGVLDLNPYVYEFAAAIEEELQAQVKRLQNLILEVINTDADEFFMMGTDWGGAAIASLSETPTQSLAALKAQWQADILSTISQKLLSAKNTGFIKIPKNIETHTDFIKWLNETQDIKCGCKTESDEKFGTLIYKCKQHDDSFTANNSQEPKK